MNRLLLAASLVALGLSGLAMQAQVAAQPTEAGDDETARLNAETNARLERQRGEAEENRAARARYEQGVRDAEAARARYDADRARYEAEAARAREAQADYERRLSEHEAATARRGGNSRQSQDSARPATARTSASRPANCEQQRRRSRNRGRALGGVIGGVAGGLAGRSAGTASTIAGAALSLPVGALLGEAFAALLDCREQEQAAVATQTVTDEAVRTGVGATSNWTSESRPNVTGSSTVTALQQEPGGGECMTVTDIVIIDGEETRAPKRLCRRPPSTRFVRV